MAGVVVNDEDWILASALDPITEDELANNVRQMRVGSVPVVDEIPASVLKNNFEILKPVLLHIVNRSIAQGVYPITQRQEKFY